MPQVLRVERQGNFDLALYCVSSSVDTYPSHVMHTIYFIVLLQSGESLSHPGYGRRIAFLTSATEDSFNFMYLLVHIDNALRGP